MLMRYDSVDIGMLIWERCHHCRIQDAKFKPRNVAPKSNMDSYLLNLSPLLHKQVPCQLKLDFLKIYVSVAKETLQTPMSVQLSFCHQNSQASNHNNESLHAQLHSWKTNFFAEYMTFESDHTLGLIRKVIMTPHEVFLLWSLPHWSETPQDGRFWHNSYLILWMYALDLGSLEVSQKN